MKHVKLISAGVIISIAMQLLFPWYIFAVVTFLMFMLFPGDKIYKAFLSGLAITTLAWFILYAWYDIQNNGILSNRMAELFGIGNKVLFLIISSLFAGIAGGLSACAGFALRRIRH